MCSIVFKYGLQASLVLGPNTDAINQYLSSYTTDNLTRFKSKNQINSTKLVLYISKLENQLH